MRMVGIAYDFDEDELPVAEITEAIVTDQRIALDWKEDGENFHAALTSSDDGISYEGEFGSPRPHAGCEVKGYRYDGKAGDVVLWLSWCRDDTGFGGGWMVYLESKNSD